jgi:hypothetical protein
MFELLKQIPEGETLLSARTKVKHNSSTQRLLFSHSPTNELKSALSFWMGRFLIIAR